MRPHSADFAAGFVGLLGKPNLEGEVFHITTEEILTWDQIYGILAAAAGASNPEIAHLPSQTIHRLDPDLGTPLIGDLMYSSAYDNSKVRRVVPDYRAKITWAEGVARSIAWYDADPARQVPDARLNARLDRLIELTRQLSGTPASSNST